jgi:hypothetical protein
MANACQGPSCHGRGSGARPADIFLKPKIMNNTVKKECQMLNYCKLVLEKMSFDRKLLLKEYRKSLRWLPTAESRQLKAWMKERAN